MRRGSRSAFSLVEVVLACALTTLLLVVLGAALMQAQGTFRNVIGTSEASDELRKVCIHLRQELMQTSAAQVSIAQFPTPLSNHNSKATNGAVPDGQAIWFLSNLDGLGTPQFLTDGTPYWQRNILYYVVIPGNHQNLFGWNCTGGAGPGGFDDRCPHKVVIRKEIDFGPATDTTVANEANVETLMTPAQIGAYLTAPVGYNVAGMVGGAVKSAHIVGRGILTFLVSSTSPGSITINTRAVSIARARTRVSLGNASMYDTPYTFHFGMTVVPFVP